MKLFDKEFSVRTHSCSPEGEIPCAIEPYVSLFIIMNTICQANCSFCEFHDNKQTEFDFEKLVKVFEEIKRKKMKIKKLNFTGGEPTLDISLIEKIISYIDDDTYVTINTNGYKLQDLIKSPAFKRIDCVSLSRHHFDTEKNYEIFHTKNIPSNEDISNFPDKRKLHLRCNLIKGQIDSFFKVQEFIDQMSSLGCFDYGFVSLMELNDFCKDQFINHTSMNIAQSRRTLLVQSLYRENICDCKNYLYYDKNGLPVKIYSRNNHDFKNCDNILVFNVNYVQFGFGGAYVF